MTDLAIEGFTDREFSVEELTSIINNVPNMFGLTQQLGLFPYAPPLSTTYFGVEINNWTLNLLPITERGAPGTQGRVGKRTKKIFEVPQITHSDSVMVADVQNLRSFAQYAPKMLEDTIADKLATMARKHFITHEWHNVTMLRGQMRDADNGVVLDVFSEFGITQGVTAFGHSGMQIDTRYRAIKRYMELNLKGETMTRVCCLASPGYMEMLFTDSRIKASYDAAMASYAAMVAVNPTLNDQRFGWVFNDVVHYEYVGSAPVLNADGSETVRQFVPDNEAIFFPLGTQECAHAYVAPGDFEESVNMPGQLFYAKEAQEKFGRGREILTQSNRLPLWKKPALLVKATIANTAPGAGNNITVDGKLT